MKILVAGGSGFVGRGLSNYLSKDYHLTLLSRSNKTELGFFNDLITWSDLKEDAIIDYDVVINLCGYNIGEKRWSKSVKEKIISSRIEPTARLAELIGDKDIWLINASAIGFYNFSDSPQDEDNHDRKYDSLTFGQQVVDQWESCLVDSHLKHYTILRFGVVVGNGGVLQKMTIPAKFGFLTKFGEGNNYMSWISLHDLCRVFEFVIDKQLKEKNIYNLTAPNACQHRKFVELLQKYMAKKYVIKMPEYAIKLMFGQMGKELLLSSQNIKPKKILEKGFVFADDSMEKAVKRYV